MSEAALQNNLLKYSVREYLFKSMICQFAKDDTIGSRRKLEKYEEMDPTFAAQREGKLCEKILDACEAYDADAFVFGSPVYYASANGSMVSFLDRAFYSNSHGDGAKAFKHKPGAVVCSARRAGTTATYDQLIKYLGISQMPIISSYYWNMVHGNTPEEVLQDEEGLSTMRQLGRNMAFFLKCLEAGDEKGLTLNEEPKARTNFIR